MSGTKTCIKCHETKPLDEFHKDNRAKDSKSSACKECSKKYYQNHREKISKQSKIRYENGGRESQGKKSMYENKLCSSYLGVVVAERLCRHLFKDVEVMPYGNTGFDIICNKGMKIDVKSSCTYLNPGRSPAWKFHIKDNTIANFFILVAFDNLTDLNPLYIWMIPGKEINDQGSASIAHSRIHKWDKWKRDINDAQLCCTEIKKEKNRKKE